MEPLSSVTPKPMLPVADRPLAAHVADAALAAGATELVFVVGYRADHVRAYFGDRYGGAPVRYAEQAELAGTADAVRAASHLLDGRFAVLNGDNLFDPESVAALFEHDAAVAAHRVESPEEYGVLSVRDGVVTGVVEKPADPPSNLANAGAYVFPASARDALDVPASERGEHEITDVLAALAARREVRVVETSRWLDVARPADLLRANALVLGDRVAATTGSVSPSATVEGDVSVAAGATVEAGATLRGPVLVARNATVGSNAVVVGPTVVGAGASIGPGAEVSKVVVLPGGRVGADVRLHDVVLGPDCDISSGGHVAGLEDESSNGTAVVVAEEHEGGRGLSY